MNMGTILHIRSAEFLTLLLGCLVSVLGNCFVVSNADFLRAAQTAGTPTLSERRPREVSIIEATGCTNCDNILAGSKTTQQKDNVLKALETRHMCHSFHEPPYELDRIHKFGLPLCTCIGQNQEQTMESLSALPSKEKQSTDLRTLRSLNILTGPFRKKGSGPAKLQTTANWLNPAGTRLL
jgi:hypothetical protein